MKAIIVDDDPLLVSQLEERCREDELFEVVGTFRNPKKALEYVKENIVEFAFLDVEMPDMNGLELGKRIRKIRPEIELVYVAGDLAGNRGKCMEVRMFGRFDIFLNGQVVLFRNAKAKELLALCLDRCGGCVSMEEAIDKLWPDRAYDDKVKRLYRKAVIDIRKTLQEKGIYDFFGTRRGLCYIYKDRVKCDYYEYLEDPEKNADLFKGEYLFDYSWGEETLAALMNEY